MPSNSSTFSYGSSYHHHQQGYEYYYPKNEGHSYSERSYYPQDKQPTHPYYHRPAYDRPSEYHNSSYRSHGEVESDPLMDHAADTLLMLSHAAFMSPSAAQSVMSRRDPDFSTMPESHVYQQQQQFQHQHSHQHQRQRTFHESTSGGVKHHGHHNIAEYSSHTYRHQQHEPSPFHSRSTHGEHLSYHSQHSAQREQHYFAAASAAGVSEASVAPLSQSRANASVSDYHSSPVTPTSSEQSPHTTAAAKEAEASMRKGNSMDVDAPHATSAASHSNAADEEDDDEGEDEVMSEGVVRVNTRLAPLTLPTGQSPTSSRGPSSVFSPITPREPSEYGIGSVEAVVRPTGSGGRRQQQQQQQPRGQHQNKGKAKRNENQNKNRRNNSHQLMLQQHQHLDDEEPMDYFFPHSPTSSSPSSTTSPASSPLSQLRILTHHFVSIQAHASPSSSRFKRPPAHHLSFPIAATPPFSPPASPGIAPHPHSPSMPNSPSKNTSTASSDSADQPCPSSPTPSGTPPSTSGQDTYVRQTGTASRSKFKPRWHTQPYMMFLALRSMPGRTAARQELITAAVELDKKFSAERGLPRVFTGKTPMNSASACLTNNGDKYFIPFKPEGSRSTHFRLAYQPGDFDTAVKEYDSWMEKLIKHDWPLCFGTPKPGALPIHLLEKKQEEEESAVPQSDGSSTEPASSSGTLGSSETSEPLASESRKRSLESDETTNPAQDKKIKVEEQSNANSGSDQSGDLVNSGSPMTSATATSTTDESVVGDSEIKVAEKMEKLDLQASSSRGKSTPSKPATTKKTYNREENDRVDEYRLEDLDLSNVPTKLSDIVRVDVSTIPNAGNGLFAVRDLPASTPLGFYFGVPMTENEFDSLKDGVGLASHYSIMYRRTVLDATDDKGMPYTDPNGRLYCPFHFMNEDPKGNISFITGAVVNQVICTTNRDIKAGEELFVFYGKEVDRHWQDNNTENNDGSNNGSDAGSETSSKPSRSSSRGSSVPPRRDPENGDRPRRTNVYKPARYTR